MTALLRSTSIAVALAVGLLGGCASESGAAADAGGRGPSPTGDAGTPATSPAIVCSACDGVCETAHAVTGAAHVTSPIAYPDPPPVGGMHHPCWGDYGVYDPAAPLPAARWVHNLEHGAVVFLYNCPQGCTETVAALAGLVDELPRTLVTPYGDMPEGVAAVAWGHRLVSSCLDADALRAFYDTHFDRGRESVSTGAPGGC